MCFCICEDRQINFDRFELSSVSRGVCKRLRVICGTCETGSELGRRRRGFASRLQIAGVQHQHKKLPEAIRRATWWCMIFRSIVTRTSTALTRAAFVHVYVAAKRTGLGGSSSSEEILVDPETTAFGR